MVVGARPWIALAGVAFLIGGCGSDGAETFSQCLLTAAEAGRASGLRITSAKSWDQEASGTGPACLYTDDDGNRLNLMWRESTASNTAETREQQAQNAAHFEELDDLAYGAFLGANGIPSVFVPRSTGHLVIVEMLDGVTAKSAATRLAVAAAERCCA